MPRGKRNTAIAVDTAADEIPASIDALHAEQVDSGEPTTPPIQNPETSTPAAADAGKPADVSAASNETESPGFAKKKFKPDPDPYGTEFILAGDNKVRLFKSMTDRAWVIRFDKNPNEGREKDDPHPVLAFLKKEAGYRWGFSDADGKGGWGKLWEDGQFNFREHMDAREVLKKCAEMLGPVQEAERVPF